MADSTDAPAAKLLPGFKSPDTVPFIYFDFVPTHGVLSGSIQIELAARTLSPLQDGKVKIEVVGTAHLRCSPTAAAFLRDAIDAALKMIEQPQHGQTSSAGKLN